MNQKLKSSLVLLLAAWNGWLRGLILGTLLGPEGANALSGPDTSVSLSDNRSENRVGQWDRYPAELSLIDKPRSLSNTARILRTA